MIKINSIINKTGLNLIGLGMERPFRVSFENIIFYLNSLNDVVCHLISLYLYV